MTESKKKNPLTIQLVTLNSKYIHSSIAIRYLREMVSDICECTINEFTINQSLELIFRSILSQKFDVIGFSTYIWNVEESLKIASSIREVRPDAIIFFGGPEVSYDSIDFLEQNTFVDYVISGEGEECFRQMVQNISEGQELSSIPGLIYRGEDGIVSSPLQIVSDLNVIPSPYQEAYKRAQIEYPDVDPLQVLRKEYENKIVYYESSRGCPYGCRFCLSSTIHSLRFFDLERVKKDLDILLSIGVSQIKFIDRSFNVNKPFASEIIRYIVDHDDGKINVHFEVNAHLLDDEIFSLLKPVRKDLFQFEIGVQSTNPNTIQAIGRTTDFDQLRHSVEVINSFGNIHQHLDLIAGLPFEGYLSFKKSFNDVYAMGAEKVQLGFLKLLKGSGLREESEKYGYKYTAYPPYEVLSNHFMTYEELIRLKQLEQVCEIYMNENLFRHTLDNVVPHFESPFTFFEKLADYWVKMGYSELSFSRADHYEKLNEFLLQLDLEDQSYLNLLRLDFLLQNKSTKMPESIRGTMLVGQPLHDLLRMKEVVTMLGIEEKGIKQVIKFVEVHHFTPPVYSGSIQGEYLLFHREQWTGAMRVFDVSEQVRREINGGSKGFLMGE